MTRMLVLGGGYAGAMAAIRLARRTRGKGVEVTLVDANETFTERVRLHQVAVGTELRRSPYAKLLARHRARFLHGRVTAIDPIGRTVRVTPGSETGGAPEITLSYDRLVYALGSRTGTSGVPGVAEHAFTLSDWWTARQAAARLRVPTRSAGRVLVVGGGLTGIECAAELAERFPAMDVQLLTGGTIAPGVSERGREHVRRSLGRLGVNVRERAPVRSLEDGAAHLEAGEELPFDMCIWAGPFVAHPLGGAAGLAVNERGQVLVDRSLRSVSHRDVYAVGDAAAIEGSPLRMGCYTAMPMAAHAADNAAAELNSRPTLPFRLGYLAQCVSLGRRNGLIQRVAPDDAPRNWILTGRRAALVKEMVCRTAFSSLFWEGRGVPLVWPKAELRRVR